MTKEKQKEVMRNIITTIKNGVENLNYYIENLQEHIGDLDELRCNMRGKVENYDDFGVNEFIEKLNSKRERSNLFSIIEKIFYEAQEITKEYESERGMYEVIKDSLQGLKENKENESMRLLDSKFGYDDDEEEEEE